jgi:hypothetical protein
MAEADICHKLLPASILDICKVFEHIHMLSIGIQKWPYTATLTKDGPSFGPSRSLVESKSCHYIMVEAECHLKLLPTSI